MCQRHVWLLLYFFQCVKTRQRGLGPAHAVHFLFGGVPRGNQSARVIVKIKNAFAGAQIQPHALWVLGWIRVKTSLIPGLSRGAQSELRVERGGGVDFWIG